MEKRGTFSPSDMQGETKGSPNSTQQKRGAQTSRAETADISGRPRQHEAKTGNTADCKSALCCKTT